MLSHLVSNCEYPSTQIFVSTFKIGAKNIKAQDAKPLGGQSVYSIPPQTMIP